MSDRADDVPFLALKEGGGVLPLVEALEVEVNPIVFSLPTYVGSSCNVNHNREIRKRNRELFDDLVK